MIIIIFATVVNYVHVYIYIKYNKCFVTSISHQNTYTLVQNSSPSNKYVLCDVCDSCVVKLLRIGLVLHVFDSYYVSMHFKISFNTNKYICFLYNKLIYWHHRPSLLLLNYSFVWMWFKIILLFTFSCQCLSL